MEPIIKVRYKEKLAILFVALLSMVSSMPQCDKSPPEQGNEKLAGDNGFSIHVRGTPRKYRPNEVYTIELRGNHDDTIAKFQDFMMVAEPSEGNLAVQNPTSLGTFHLLHGDAMTKFSHKCSHSVEATSSMNKENITVYWTSPPKSPTQGPKRGDRDGCIDFKAMVVERQDVWYMDDGGLTYTICEDDGPLAEPPVVEPCCACDEAKYEVIFEGIWSRHTHPKDFPMDEWKTMFSTLIGASHSQAYTLWEYGSQASQALQVLAESQAGNTFRLEREMKQYSGNIRSVVKAHGLQQRSNVVGQTFAVFRVDRLHHLLSVVSKMVPSPDWIVGLSKENLCLPNCSWVDNRVIDLYPWDIGTDSGLRYDGTSAPQRPKGTIQRITSSNPHSAESPFYDNTGAPMKPAARLHLIKQREYFKTCPPGVERPGMTQGNLGINPSWINPDQGGGGFGDGSGGTSYYYGTGVGPTGENYGDTSGASTADDYNNFGSNTYDDYNSQQDPASNYENLEYSDYGSPTENVDPCATTEWDDWTQCSATCGSASKSRTRYYSDQSNADRNGCTELLFEKQPCKYLEACPTRSYVGHFNPFEVDQMSGYSSQWSERGLEAENQVRGQNHELSYSYDGSAQNVPNVHSSNTRQRQQNSMQRQHSGQNQDSEAIPVPEKFNAPINDAPTCDVSNWGEWSDCSSKCDSGSRTRNRHYEYPDRSNDCTHDLYEVQSCRGNEADCPPPREPINSYGQQPPVTNMGFGGSYGNSYEQQTTDRNCRTTDWSDWSPCSKKCGTGSKRRTKLFIVPFVPNRSCDVRLYDKQDCYTGSDPSCDNYGQMQNSAQNSYNQDPEIDNYERSANRVVQTLGQNTIHNLPHDFDDNDMAVPQDRCSLEKDPGSCHSHTERWYFDSQTGTCRTFSFTGCRGNRNNFPGKQQCEDACIDSSINQNQNPQDNNNRPQYWTNTNHHSSYTPSAEHRYNQFPSLNLELEQPEEEIPMRPQIPLTRDTEIDCSVSAWSTWSACTKSCGNGGWQTRHREVLINPSTYGKSCPRKLMRRRKCRQMPCPADTAYWYQGSWRHMVDPDDE